MKLKWVLTGILAFSVTCGTAVSEVKVIANFSVKASQISANELKSVFLAARTSLADGTHVEPVLLRSGVAHNAFVKEYTGKTASGLENYYRSMVFAGKGMMPKIFASEAEVLAYVKKTKGAIGYISAEGDAAGVKRLEVK